VALEAVSGLVGSVVIVLVPNVVRRCVIHALIAVAVVSAIDVNIV